MMRSSIPFQLGISDESVCRASHELRGQHSKYLDEISGKGRFS